jgi:hypothetical protein
MAVVLGAGTPAAAGFEVIHIYLEGDPARVPKGNTITRKVLEIPPGIPGTLVLRIKWHTPNIVPTYPPLRVELRHGTGVVLAARNCYSLHSPSTQTPKCNYSINVTATEAARSGDWSLVVTNNSEFDVSDLTIYKTSFSLDPTVPVFHSTFTTDCPDRVNLDMEGSTLTVLKGNTQERRLYNIGAANGDVDMMMKFHAASLIPNTFHRLKVEVMNGTSVVASSNCYSIHAWNSLTPQCIFNFQTGSRPTNAWKLRVTNSASDDAKEFDIRRGSDPNPFINATWESHYKARCQ